MQTVKLELPEQVSQKEFGSFVSQYVETMIWASSGTDSSGKEYESLHCFDVAQETLEKAKTDCLSFICDNLNDVLAASAFYGLDTVAHDFWLTRNGHGAGFWDGDLPKDLGERLTKAAEIMGEQCPYIGEDELVYLG